MNFKRFFYIFFMLLLLSFTVKAEVFNRKDISTITIHKMANDSKNSLIIYSLVIKITADSIIIPHEFCNDEECPTYGRYIEYQGNHDIFKFVPEKYLIESNYIDPLLYEGTGIISSSIVEICITDGRCHLWNYEGSDDKEMILFNNKLNEILSGKSKYQFHSKMLPQ